MWEEPNPEMDRLKKQAIAHETRAANLAQQLHNAEEQLADMRSTHNDDVYKLQQQATELLAAQELARKKIEELKIAQVQRANFQQHGAALEREVESAKQEIKRLNYELERISSARSVPAAATSNAATRAAEERAASLEKQVQSLTTRLQAAESAADKDKENLGPTATGIPVTSKRNSISHADAVNGQARSRFGFGAPGGKPRTSMLSDPSATPARPASSLGHHSTHIPGPTSSAIPKRRRSSSFSGIPAPAAVSTASAAPRIAQLEREVEDSRSKADSIEKDFLAVKTKLSAKERELLTVENKLLALERAKADEVGALRARLEDVSDEMAESQERAEETKLAIRAEMDRVIKDAREEKQGLMAKIQRMQAELEKKEEEIEGSELQRVELEEALEQLKMEDEAQRSELERQLSQAQAQLETETARTTQRDQLELELATTKAELASSNETLQSAMKKLSASKIHLEQDKTGDVSRLAQESSGDDLPIQRQLEEELAATKADLAAARTEIQASLHTLIQERSEREESADAPSSDLEQIKAELEATQLELSRALERAADLETRDVVPAKSNRAEVEAAERQINELNESLDDTKATIQRLEKDKMRLEAQLRDFEDREQEWISQEKTMLEDLAQVERQLQAAHVERETVEAGSAESATQARDLLAKIADIEQIMADKEVKHSALVEKLQTDVKEHLLAATTAADAQTSLEASLAAVTTERDSVRSSYSDLQQQILLTASLPEELASAKAALQRAQVEHAAATELAEGRSKDLEVLQQSLDQAHDRLQELETSSAERSVDSSRIDELETALAAAKAHAEELAQQVEELEKVEWGANEARQAAEGQVAELEARIEELETSSEATEIALRAAYAEKEQELAEITLAAEEADSRASSAVEALTAKTRECSEYTETITELRRQIVEHEMSLETLSALETELDTLRNTSKDAAFAAMEESQELNRRIVQQHQEIDSLNGRIVGLELLQSAVDAAEGRAAALASQLEAAESRTLAFEQESESRDLVARSCIEEADAEISRLRSELESTLSGLREAHERAAAATTAEDEREATDDTVGEDAGAVAPLWEVDASILVRRLREERDELRTRLEFVQRETAFQAESHLTQLRQAEDAKSHEVARANEEILKLTAQLATETDSLDTAQTNVARLQGLLDTASEEVQRLQEASRASTTKSVEQSEPTLGELEGRLQAQVQELQARVLRRTETIGRHEQTIASLRIQLAANDADDDGEEDTREIQSSDLPLQSAQDVKNLQMELEKEENARAGLRAQLEATIHELESAKLQIASMSAATDELNRELGAALEAEAELTEQLEEAKALHDDAESRTLSLMDELAALKSMHAELGQAHEEAHGEINELALQLELQEADHEDSLERIEQLLVELADVKERHSDALGQLELTKSSFEALRPSMLTMESRLEDSEAAQGEMRQRLAQKEAQHQELEGLVADLQASNARLTAEIAQAASTKEGIASSDLARIAELEGDLSAITARLTDALRELSVAGQEADALRLELTATTQALAVAMQKQSLHDETLSQSQAHAMELEVAAEALKAAHHAELAQIAEELAEVAQRESAGSVELDRLRDELRDTSSREEELNRLQRELQDTQVEISSLHSRVHSVTADLDQANADVHATRSSHARAEQSFKELEQDHAGRKEEIVGLKAQLDEALADLTAMRREFDAFVDKAGGNDEQLQAVMHEHALIARQLEDEKADLSSQLQTAQHELQAVQDKTQQDLTRLQSFEDQLHGAQREIEGLNELVQSERETLSTTKATLEAELESERQGVEKAKAALEAAMRENKTLRSLARGAEANLEAYKSEKNRLETISVRMEQDVRSLEARYQDLERTSQANIAELLDTLQLAEEAKADAERRQESAETQLQDIQAVPRSSAEDQQAILDLTEHVKDLEKQLETKIVETEETDERYMEVLKHQKRYLGQIERLKAKIASLQRDLTNAKAASSSEPTPALEVSAVATVVPPTSTGKKRRAPSEFDPLPTTTAPPRAVVASAPRSPTMKENDLDVAVASTLTRTVLSFKRDSGGDGIVPLKPAALSPQPPREPLKAVGANGARDASGAPTNASKVQELRARLAAQRQRAGVAGP